MGAFTSCDATWASDQLSASVPQKLSNLTGLRYMADNAKRHAARQGQLAYCCYATAPTLPPPTGFASCPLLRPRMPLSYMTT